MKEIDGWEELELELEEELSYFLSNLPYSEWVQETFKFSSYKISFSLFYPKNFLKIPSPYLFSANQIAHHLSKNKNIESLKFVKNIILLPKFVQTKDYFLTNIYFVERQSLFFYLTPTRLYFSGRDAYLKEKDMMFSRDLSKERITWNEMFFTKFENLFFLLGYILHDKKKYPKNLIKFLEKKERLTANEISEMQLIHELFVYHYLVE
ncbi:MAG: hypothetical protein NZ853_01730 [Leptospiraceae bacterium]|nr:hypothetical protein [Leptospiraceae bacterium]MDW7976053.1 hypothetical protein [Leptospiraceae bacterium]